MPVRIQRRRTKGWRLPANTVVVDRSSEFGNPFKVSIARHRDRGSPPKVEWWVEAKGINGVWRFATAAEAHAGAVKLYRHWVDHNAPMNYKDRAKLALRGRDLACWCRLDQPCHVDVLLEIANQ